MPEWLVAVVSLVGSTIITTVIGVIIKYVITKEFEKQNRYKELEEREQAIKRKEELQLQLSLQLKPIEEKLDDIESKVVKSTNGTLSSLRNDILTCYYRCREKGYRNDYDYQNIHDLFIAYEELGGNSFIRDIMNRFDHLPVKEDVKDIDAHMGTKKSTKKVLNENKK